MKEKDLPIDRSRHVIYTKKAMKCVQKLLRRYYDERKAAGLWEKIQLQYVEFLKDEPALGGVKMTVSIYDPTLIFAWYVVVPDKPYLPDIQQDVYDCFMSGFDVLGKVFDLNRRLDNRLANIAFKNTNNQREKEIKAYPESFRMGYYDYDRENGVVRYSFTQCPNAEFAKRHHLENVLPVMCNCDHLAMKKLHAALIREGTCVTAECCDYCIVGDKNPLTAEYENVMNEQGLIITRKLKGKTCDAV
jgi:hypothetical protein